MLMNEILKKGEALKNKIEIIKGLKGCYISSFFRIGDFSDELYPDVKSILGKKDMFRSVRGLFLIDAGAESIIVIIPIRRSDIFIKLCEVRRELVEDYISGESDISNTIYYNNTTYGEEYLSQYIGKKIEKVAVIKKTDSSKKFEYFPIEKGVLFQFEGMSGGVAIGIHLFPELGSMNISCIPEEYIYENRNGIPEIVWLD